MEPLRIQKFLAEQGLCSRRKAEELVQSGKVLVNGNPAELGQKVTGKDHITFEGSAISTKKKEKMIIAFHKPVGVETTCKKIEGQKTIADFRFAAERLFPIGRLDKDSRGLLLLTNDGELANVLMHPRYEHEKEYLVTVNKKLTLQHLKTLSEPIVLDEKTTQRCSVKQIMPTVFRILLKEGINRQIRRMCTHCDLAALDLIRIRIENIHLGELPVGKSRVLSEAEVASLKKKLKLV